MSRRHLKLWIIAAALLLAAQILGAKQRVDLDLWVVQDELPLILTPHLLKDRYAEVTLTDGTQMKGEIIRVQPRVLTVRSGQRDQPRLSEIDYERISTIQLRGEPSEARVSAGQTLGVAGGLTLGMSIAMRARSEVGLYGIILGTAVGRLAGEAVGRSHRKRVVIHIQH